FYSDTHSRETDHLHATRLPDSFTFAPALAGKPLDLTVPTITGQSELAAFGMFRHRPFDSRLVLSAGVRIARLMVDVKAGPPLDDPQHRSETQVAPQYGLSYDASSATVKREFYFDAGEGYAPGSVDAARPTCFEKPILYPTDTLWSYEAGVRHSWDAGEG